MILCKPLTPCSHLAGAAVHKPAVVGAVAAAPRCQPSELVTAEAAVAVPLSADWRKSPHCSCCQGSLGQHSEGLQLA